MVPEALSKQDNSGDVHFSEGEGLRWTVDAKSRLQRPEVTGVNVRLSRLVYLGCEKTDFKDTRVYRSKISPPPLLYLWRFDSRSGSVERSFFPSLGLGRGRHSQDLGGNRVVGGGRVSFPGRDGGNSTPLPREPDGHTLGREGSSVLGIIHSNNSYCDPPGDRAFGTFDCTPEELGARVVCLDVRTFYCAAVLQKLSLLGRLVGSVGHSCVSHSPFGTKSLLLWLRPSVRHWTDPRPGRLGVYV